MKKLAKNFFWASFIAWNVFFLFVVSGKKKPLEKTEQTEQIAAPVKNTNKKTILKKEQITTIETDLAILNFQGDRLQNVELKKYKQNNENKKIVDNEPVEIIWKGDITPKNDCVWDIAKKDNAIIMQTSYKGVIFIKTWEVDNDYGIKCKTYIKNNSNEDIQVQTYIKSSKKEFEKHQSLLFSGISIFDGKKRKNIKATKVKNNNVIAETGKAWCAFNQKYWLVALTSDQGYEIKISDKNNVKNNFEINISNKPKTIASKEESSETFNIYIGPKKLESLQKFGHSIGMPNIEHTIDYGWLFFLTKPLHYIFNFLVKQFSSIILALIIISIILKLITWPLTSSSHITMQRMHLLSPEIKEIRQRFKDNPQLMNGEIFALYKRQKINPMSSFLPAILQMLMLFPLYKVLSFSIELYQVSFPFWISDLSSKDPTSILNLFGILPFQAPDFFQVGAWPVLMGLTMIIQQMLSSIPESQEQKMMQYIMPIFFTWIMSALPSGVVIYWTLMNVLTILQILYLNIRLKKA